MKDSGKRVVASGRQEIASLLAEAIETKMPALGRDRTDEQVQSMQIFKVVYPEVFCLTTAVPAEGTF